MRSRQAVCDRAGKSDDEGRSPANGCLEPQLASVPVDDHRTRNGQTLSRPFSDLLGREERIEDPGLDVFGDAATVVGYPDLDPIASRRVLTVMIPLESFSRLWRSTMACAALTIKLRNTWLQAPGRQFTEGRSGSRSRIGFGAVLPFVAADRQGAFERLVDVNRLHLVTVRMRELLHRSHDVGDPFDSFERLVDGLRDLA